MAHISVKRLRRNIKLLKIGSFFDGLWPYSLIVAVYFESIAGSYTLALSLISLITIIQIITEIPTGVFSDRIGRKYTLILGSFLYAGSALLWAMAGTFNSVELLFAGVVLFGIVCSLFSGTYMAFLYETMKDLKREDEFDIVNSQIVVLELGGAVAMTGFVAIITYIFPTSNLPFQVLYYIAVLFSLVMMVCFFMCVEPKKKKNTHKVSSFKHFMEGFSLIVNNKKLRLFSMIKIFSTTITSAIKEMESVYFVSLVPFYFVSVAKFIGYSLGALGVYIAPYFKVVGFGNVVFVSQFLISGVKLFAVILNNFFTPFINTLVNLFDGVSGIAEDGIEQEEFSEQQRATMGSIIAFGEGIVNSLVLVILGIVADFYSVRTAFFLVVFVKIIIDASIFFRFRKLKRRK